MARTNTGIRVGIGGWTFEPWRGVFYPPDLPQRKELEYAGRRLTSIEINGTYYGSQKKESFARWRDETPNGFVFSLKGPRFAVNRTKLADAGPSIERFLTSGILELGEKLGPVNWQFLPTKHYDPADFEAFLKLLPQSLEGRSLRHAVEVRHQSFREPGFVALLRDYGVAAVLTDKEGFPEIADVTASFVYARLQRSSESVSTGYPSGALDLWTKRARIWNTGDAPDDLDWLGSRKASPPSPRDVFIYFINGYKPKAPAAAMALIEKLSGS